MPPQVSYVLPKYGSFAARLYSLVLAARRIPWRRWVKRRARSLDRPLSVLDIGCGPGSTLVCLRKWFPDSLLFGLDTNSALLSTAMQRVPNANFVQEDACCLPFANDSFDAIFATHICEHIERPQDFFSEVLRILRPGGILLLATPNLGGLGAKLLGAKWMGYSDSTHISLANVSTWRDRIATSGLQIEADGTTGLAGIPIVNQLPISLLYLVPLLIFGFFPWSIGEAYIAIARKS